MRAHGANEKMIGKNLMEMKDIDGKPFVKERVELAQSKGTFWQDYKFTNPETKRIEPKSMYCEKLDDTAVCGGIYKLAASATEPDPEQPAAARPKGADPIANQ